MKSGFNECGVGEREKVEFRESEMRRKKGLLMVAARQQRSGVAVTVSPAQSGIVVVQGGWK